MNTDEKYMLRCIELAKLGNGSVAPNPMVGAILVYDNKVIGEGYHQQYGKAHAEVNCINNVAIENIDKIKDATLYISLEPCNHFGKTPPCTHLITQKKIKKVVIGCRDSFALVNGTGIEFLQQHGIHVITNVLQQECANLNKRFFTFHQKKRPYIILKFAQTADEKIAGISDERLFISNAYTNKLVHKWRSEETAILIGTNTALKDNPTLTNRLYTGKNPTRLIIDKNLLLPNLLNIFNTDAPTVIFNELKNEHHRNITFVKIDKNTDVIHQILHYCYQNKLISIIVEGGAKILNSFIEKKLWDEMRVITNTSLILGKGIKAPKFSGLKFKIENILTDTITHYLPNTDE